MNRTEKIEEAEIERALGHERLIEPSHFYEIGGVALNGNQETQTDEETS
jgi:hypothetical protein